jgi:S1-C subfamily serine protease
MEQIISTGRVARGWLGVSARDVVNDTTGAGAGAALVGVLRGGPADKAGLRAADTVVAINGKEVADTAELVAQTAALNPGTRVQFKVLRGGEPLTMGVELGQRPPPPSR